MNLVTCPNCNQSLNLPESAAAAVPCPSCGVAIDLVGATQSGAASATSDGPSPVDGLTPMVTNDSNPDVGAAFGEGLLDVGESSNEASDNAGEFGDGIDLQQQLPGFDSATEPLQSAIDAADESADRAGDFVEEMADVSNVNGLADTLDFDPVTIEDNDADIPLDLESDGELPDSPASAEDDVSFDASQETVSDAELPPPGTDVPVASPVAAELPEVNVDQDVPADASSAGEVPIEPLPEVEVPSDLPTLELPADFASAETVEDFEPISPEMALPTDDVSNVVDDAAQFAAQGGAIDDAIELDMEIDDDDVSDIEMEITDFADEDDERDDFVPADDPEANDDVNTDPTLGIAGAAAGLGAAAVGGGLAAMNGAVDAAEEAVENAAEGASTVADSAADTVKEVGDEIADWSAEADVPDTPAMPEGVQGLTPMPPQVDAATDTPEFTPPPLEEMPEGTPPAIDGLTPQPAMVPPAIEGDAPALAPTTEVTDAPPALTPMPAGPAPTANVAPAAPAKKGSLVKTLGLVLGGGVLVGGLGLGAMALFLPGSLGLASNDDTPPAVAQANTQTPTTALDGPEPAVDPSMNAGPPPTDPGLGNDAGPASTSSDEPPISDTVPPDDPAALPTTEPPMSEPPATNPLRDDTDTSPPPAEEPETTPPAADVNVPADPTTPNVDEPTSPPVDKPMTDPLEPAIPPTEIPAPEPPAVVAEGVDAAEFTDRLGKAQATFAAVDKEAPKNTLRELAAFYTALAALGEISAGGLNQSQEEQVDSLLGAIIEQKTLWRPLATNAPGWLKFSKRPNRGFVVFAGIGRDATSQEREGHSSVSVGWVDKENPLSIYTHTEKLERVLGTKALIIGAIETTATDIEVDGALIQVGAIRTLD